MAIVVPISSTWDSKGIDQAVKAINKAGQQLGSIQSSTKKSSESLDNFGLSVKKLGILVAGTFGATQVASFFKASIQGAIQDEASLRKLNKTLENMGFAGSANQVDKFIGKLQYSAAIADDELRPALNNLVVATGNLSQSQKLLQVALDVSAGSGRDLDTITVALAKAYNGNFAALKKLNLGIDESLIKNKDLNGILSVLTTKFAGASANAVDTYAGKMKVLSLAVGDAQELIGYALLDALDKSTGSTQDFAQSIQELGQGVADTITGFSYYVGQIQDLAGALGLASDNTKSLMDETSDFFDKTVQLIPIVGTYIKLMKDKGRAERIANAPAQTSPAGTRLARQAKEVQDALKEQTYQSDLAKKAAQELQQNIQSLTETSANYAKFVAGTGPQSIEGATLLAQNALGSIQKIMANHPKINDGLVKSFKDLASVVQTNFSYALDQARTKLDQAKQQYNAFKDSIKSSITGVVSFTTIEEGSTFLDSLTKQAKQAKDFGGQIQQLLTMGLNRNAIQQVAMAGYEVGSVIADEIIKGGSTVVDQVNTLVASVESVGETVSSTLAEQFYAAGVNAAQTLVDALIAQLNASVALIAQAIANATKGMGTTADTKTTKKPTTKKKKALGGNVFPNTSYLVGENGPEIFSPLTSGNIIPNNRIGSRSGASISITVNAGIGTNGAQVGKEIVDAIKKFERTSGPVFASA